MQDEFIHDIAERLVAGKCVIIGRGNDEILLAPRTPTRLETVNGSRILFTEHILFKSMYDGLQLGDLRGL